ncbi:MAG: oxidoreductase [Paenibacillaceae bacterium]
MKTTIKVGLIGYGFGGAVFHAPMISAVDGLELSVIYTSNEEKVRLTYPNVLVTTDLNDIWSHTDIELVVISTPNTSHYELAKSALEAGKHVVIDKPFIIDITEGENLIALAKEKGKLLSVYQSRRWDSDFQTVRRLITEEKLGQIYSFEVHYDRFRPEVKDRWKERNEPGSGTLYDLGAHLIDQALQLFGKPLTVTADCLSQRPGSHVNDYFHVILGYGICRVILHSSSLVRGRGPRYQIHGSKASFIKFGEDPQERTLLEGLRPGMPGWGIEDPAEYGEIITFDGLVTAIPSEIGAYEQFYERMYQAIVGNGPVPVIAEQSLDVIRVIQLAERSSEEGRTLKFT